MSETKGSYLFGDSDLAAQRLERLHEIFRPTSVSFLERRGGAAGGGVRVAIDVGCGVGCTTEMLRGALTPALAAGVDLSPPFLERALERRPRCSFVRADVAAGLPLRSVDLAYARYVLLHMPRPLETLRAWSACVRPGGQILIEENLSYESSNAVLSEYMDTSEEVMRDNGQDLYIGAALGEWVLPESLHVAEAREVDVAVPAAAAAAIFSMNFPAWRERARQHRSVDALDRLAARLGELAGSTGGGSITWRLLQIALVRRGDPGP